MLAGPGTTYGDPSNDRGTLCGCPPVCLFPMCPLHSSPSAALSSNCPQWDAAVSSLVKHVPCPISSPQEATPTLASTLTSQPPLPTTLLSRTPLPLNSYQTHCPLDHFPVPLSFTARNPWPEPPSSDHHRKFPTHRQTDPSPHVTVTTSLHILLLLFPQNKYSTPLLEALGIPLTTGARLPPDSCLLI